MGFCGSWEEGEPELAGISSRCRIWYEKSAIRGLASRLLETNFLI